MQLTVSDILNAHRGVLRPIAGKGGVARPVLDVGILDYELLPGLKTKYQRANFHDGQVVLSTFLYARDDPYQIVDAVKYLVARNTSALVIKNVLHLAIPEQALRYANARNYPILLVEGEDFFFDEFISDVSERTKMLQAARLHQREIDALLRDCDEPEAARLHALRLNPSFREECAAVFAMFAEPLSGDAFREVEARCLEGAWSACEHFVTCYDGGLLAIATSDPEMPLDLAALAEVLQNAAMVGETPSCKGVGTSLAHVGLDLLGSAIEEAWRAARLSTLKGGGPLRYCDLGIYRAILPFANSDAMRRYAAEIMEPLRDHDVEHGTQLEETLRAFVECGRSVCHTATRLGQHQNTVRYRLECVGRLVGLDFRNAQDAEQLSLACRIETANELFPPSPLR